MGQTLPYYDEALDTILSHVTSLPTRSVSMYESMGTVLRRDVVADRDQPPFDRSMMDGFAVRLFQLREGGAYEVRGSIAAGVPAGKFPDTGVVRIATGAPLPTGADAVVPVEQAEVETSKGTEHVRFHAGSVSSWSNVHPRGSDAALGQVLIPAGTRIGLQHVGIAATVGASQLEVSQSPRITLLTSGDEVRRPDTELVDLKVHQIRNSNGPMLMAFFSALGAPIMGHEHLVDEPESTLAAAREAIGRSHLVVTVGGVSVGQRDWLGRTWEKLGLEKLVNGVAIQPGKPVLVARDKTKLVVGLPGNPVSALATAHLFVWPVIRKLMGIPTGLGWRQVQLMRATKANDQRQLFRAVRLDDDGDAWPLHWHGSGDLVHTSKAAGLVRLPLIDDEVESGTILPFLPWVG